MPLIPPLGRLRQEDLCEFEASAGSKATEKPVSTNKNETKR